MKVTAQGRRGSFRGLRIGAIVFLGAVVLAGCPGDHPAELDLRSLSVTPSHARTVVGETVSYEVTHTGSDGAESSVTQRVTMISQQPDVARQDAEPGHFVALSEGTATIDVSLGELRAEATLEVVTAQGLEVTPPQARIEVGSTVQLSVAVATASGGPVTVSSAGWSSTNEGAASVDPDGVVRGVSPGDATIEVAHLGFTGSADITVYALDRLDLTPPAADVEVGDRVAFTLEARYSDGVTEDVTGDAEWSISSPIASPVSGTPGAYTATAPGNTTVTATLGGKSDHASLRVVDPNATDEYTVAVGAPWEGTINLSLASSDNLANPTDRGDSDVGFNYLGFDVRGDYLIGASAIGFPFSVEMWELDLSQDPVAESSRWTIDGATDLRQVVVTPEGEILTRGPSELFAFTEAGVRIPTPYDQASTSALAIAPGDAPGEYRVSIAFDGGTPEIGSVTRDRPSDTWTELPGTRQRLRSPANLVIGLARFVFTFGSGGIEGFYNDGSNARIGSGALSTEPATTGAALDPGSGSVIVLWVSPQADDELACLTVDPGSGLTIVGTPLALGGTIEAVSAPDEDGPVGLLWSDVSGTYLTWLEARGRCEMVELATVAMRVATDLVIR